MTDYDQTYVALLRARRAKKWLSSKTWQPEVRKNIHRSLFTEHKHLKDLFKSWQPEK